MVEPHQQLARRLAHKDRKEQRKFDACIVVALLKRMGLSMMAKLETTVFIVDGAPLVVRHLVELIESAGHARVVGSSDNAREALTEILHRSPSVVLLDLHLRAGSGIDLLVGLTSAGCRAIKIVATNCIEPMARAAALTAGADFFYDKTLEFQEAIARINAPA